MSKKNQEIKVIKEVAVGDQMDGNSEVSLLRSKLEEHERRHIVIKAEFEALKTLNHELSQKHDKHVKELKLDLRIAKKDADKWQDTNRYLREEKKELRDQLAVLQTTSDQLKQQMKTKDEQIEQLMRQIESLNKDMDSKHSDIRTIRESFEDRIKRSDNETKALREQLNKELNWKEKFNESNRKSDKLSKEMEALRRQMLDIQNDLSAKNHELVQKDKEIQKLKSSYKLLKDQCLEMDRQTEQFKNKYQGLGVIKQKLTLEKDSTQTEVQRLNHQIQNLEIQLNSCVKEKEDILKRVESQESQFNDISRTERERILTLEDTLHQQYQKIREYEERLSAQEEIIYSNDNMIQNLDQKISYLEEELYAIKEEAAKHITTIGDLKEQNRKLTLAIEDLVEKQEGYQERVDSLHHELELKEEEMNRERIASQETVGQQLKLIDFLQMKIHGLEKQKKPLFSITPTKKFVNNSPRPINSLEVKDLDRLLAEEKTKNRRLIDELNRLKSEVKNSIKSELCHDSSETFRKPLFAENRRKTEEKKVETEVRNTTSERWQNSSSGRMNHNIPHRFVEITNKIPNNRCVSCAEIIHFGKKAQKCNECNATIHPKCGHRLPNNCGLPVQLMQQLFNSSHDVNGEYSQNYYQSKPIDDVIEVNPIPSAPEESFAKYDHSDSSATTDNNDSYGGDVLDTPVNLKEIEDICDNKENDNFSFSDSLIDMIERADHL